MRFTAPLVAVATAATVATALPFVHQQQQPAQLAFSATPSDSIAAVHADLAAAAQQLPAEQLAELDEWIAALPQRRKVQLAEGDEPLDISEGEKALLVLAGKRFVDVTDDVLTTSVATKEAFPAKLTYQTAQLQPLFDRLSQKDMSKFLESFTAFRTRHYRSDTGKQSQQFLLGQVRQVAASNKDVHVTVREFKHEWVQNSIIARLETPKGKKDVSDAVVIIGAHQDSTNLLPFLAAPGADDDASGTTSILSAFKSLVESGFQPSYAPVEFHWYSAEEGGLLGSKEVAQDYAQRGVRVRAMQQNDMTAYVKPGTAPAIGVIQDYVDPEFTAYLTRLIGEYAEIPVAPTQCGYACSDHASWSKVGAPAAFTIESTFEDSDKNIHSTRDTVDQPGYSVAHVEQFARVAIALAVELGGGESVVY
ncbi:hypothetical protein Rhopal_003761-T1 [Rhodotorula paludigena]|uniref:Peptide hydrolase n=1 Tax=Rhodotorula paludigena TaxID=86838 RepID=A0AAV5GN13_9BASI|nr:hypothetical protein Rhopal_003761-T1 [Rhodotorula paludigena]